MMKADTINQIHTHSRLTTMKAIAIVVRLPHLRGAMS